MFIFATHQVAKMRRNPAYFSSLKFVTFITMPPKVVTILHVMLPQIKVFSQKKR